jgi:hypothetical protein
MRHRWKADIRRCKLDNNESEGTGVLEKQCIHAPTDFVCVSRYASLFASCGRDMDPSELPTYDVFF